MKVVTFCDLLFHPGYYLLHKTLGTLGYDHVNLSLPWENYVHRWKAIRTYLSSLPPNEVLIVCDGTDVVFTIDAKTMASKAQRNQLKLKVSYEIPKREYFMKGYALVLNYFTQMFFRPTKQLPNCVNPGTLMGQVKYILEFIDLLFQHAQKNTDDQFIINSSQPFLQHLLRSGFIDLDHSYFQVVFNKPAFRLPWSPTPHVFACMRNLDIMHFTGDSMPSVMHHFDAKYQSCATSVHCINLQLRKDRHRTMTTFFQDHKIDAQFYHPTKHKNGRIGCFQSHFHVLDTAMSDIIIVFEDDARLAETREMQKWEQVLSLIRMMFTLGYDYFSFGGPPDVTHWNFTTLVPGVVSGKFITTLGYAIKKTAFERIKRDMLEAMPTEHVDHCFYIRIPYACGLKHPFIRQNFLDTDNTWTAPWLMRIAPKDTEQNLRTMINQIDDTAGVRGVQGRLMVFVTACILLYTIWFNYFKTLTRRLVNVVPMMYRFM